MIPVSNSRLKKLVVTFSFFIAAVVLDTLKTSSFCTSHNQEVSNKENLPFQSTRNHANPTRPSGRTANDIHYKRPVLHKRKPAIRQTWLVKKST